MEFWENDIKFWRAEQGAFALEMQAERALTDACRKWAEQYEGMLKDSKLVYSIKEQQAIEKAAEGGDYFGFDPTTGEKRLK